jgi:hypothetical protein
MAGRQPRGPVILMSSVKRLVAKRQSTVFGRKFGDELASRRFRGVDLAEIANLPASSSATATALRNFDVSIPTKAPL